MNDILNHAINHDFNHSHHYSDGILGNAPFKCPMCRAVFEIEEGHSAAASSLPINHFASTVLPAASASSSLSNADPNNVVCEICEENQPVNTARIVLSPFATLAKGFT